MNITKILNESLSPFRTAFHFTNAWNLLKILESGGLKPGRRTTGNIALSIVRPSAVNSKTNLINLSPEIGEVKIILDINKMSEGKVRGLKVRAHADYPQQDKKKLNLFFKNRPELKTKVLKTFKESEKKVRLLLKMNNFNAEKIDDIIKFLKERRKNLIDREGEERLYTKGNKLIKLDPDYMKIELLPKFKEEVKVLYDGEPDKIQDLKDIIRKNSALFIKNDSYRKFMG